MYDAGKLAKLPNMVEIWESSNQEILALVLHVECGTSQVQFDSHNILSGAAGKKPSPEAVCGQWLQCPGLRGAAEDF